MSEDCGRGTVRSSALETTHGGDLRLSVSDDALCMYAAIGPGTATMGLLARIRRALERALCDCAAAAYP